MSVSGWVTDGPRSHPSLVDWNCPFCSRMVSFSATLWRPLEGPNWYSQAACPGCKGNVQIFTFDVGSGYNSLCGGKLFIYPAAQVRTPLIAVLENAELSAPLKAAYKSAVQVVSAKQLNAGAAMCRRLLEGIAKTVLPIEKHGFVLAKQLEELPKHRDLGKPLVDLAHAIRQGGNFGAHFDFENETDEHAATLMLELCEDLMVYLFTLPVQIRELQTKINLLRQQPSGDSDIRL